MERHLSVKEKWRRRIANRQTLLLDFKTNSYKKNNTLIIVSGAKVMKVLLSVNPQCWLSNLDFDVVSPSEKWCKTLHRNQATARQFFGVNCLTENEIPQLLRRVEIGNFWVQFQNLRWCTPDVFCFAIHNNRKCWLLIRCKSNNLNFELKAKFLHNPTFFFDFWAFLGR